MLKQPVEKVLIFKMNSGEEVIARVNNKEDGFYAITNPMTVVVGPNGIQLAPYLMLADPSTEIMIAATTITARPKASYEQEYLSLISGIKLPAKSDIIV